MDALPIDRVLPDLLAALHSAGAAVLVAPTGAGKTTRVAPAVADRVEGRVLLTQPRRVAARAAAAHIAAERGWRHGGEVGHHVRLDRRACDDTRVLVVTEGILLRMLQDDPFLEGVGAVLLDELHERSLQLDLALALLAEVRSDARPDLWLAAMSATVDPEPVAAWLGARVVRSEGRTFPVEIRTLPRPDERPVEVGVGDLVRQALSETDGDVLVFLPGVAEIRRTAGALADLPVAVHPLYGDLPAAAQDAALRPGPGRRVVLATNVAETSLTVPGIAAVVDSGLARVLRADPSSGLDRLDVVRISAASADQRAGRAGRERPGVCYRWWTERMHQALPARSEPEIRRVDLSGPVLQILAWGGDPRGFGWFEAPPEHRIDAALALLRDLGAWDGHLTPMGRQLAALPTHPRIARMLVDAHRGGAGWQGALAAVLLGERDPLRGFASPTPSDSDVVDRIEALEREGGFPVKLARRLHRQLRSALGPEGTGDGLLRALYAGWPDRLGRRRQPGSDRFRLLGGRGARLDRSSAVRDAELIVALDVEDSGPEARIRLASAVDPGWLPTEVIVETRFDPGAERVSAVRQVRVGDLVLQEHPAQPDPVEASAALEQAARRDPTRVLPDDDALHQLLARVACSRLWMPELGLPEVDAVALLPMVCVGRRSFADLRRADWARALRDHLGWEGWQAVEAQAPPTLTVPSGARIRLRYEVGRAPVLAVRMQALFGWRHTPTVAKGRVPVLLHLLAPNGRPQQITDDLAGFWERTWPEIRRELRARYPKHAWPEDPREATPRRR